MLFTGCDTLESSALAQLALYQFRPLVLDTYDLGVPLGCKAQQRTLHFVKIRVLFVPLYY